MRIKAFFCEVVLVCTFFATANADPVPVWDITIDTHAMVDVYAHIEDMMTGEWADCWDYDEDSQTGEAAFCLYRVRGVPAADAAF